MKELWTRWFSERLIKDNPEFIKFHELLPDFSLSDYRHLEVRKRNIELIKDRSSLFRQIILDKGGWLFPEKVYRNNPTYLTRAEKHDEGLDNLILNNNLAFSLFTRFKFISNELLPRYINKLRQSKDKIKIASFGSGTGLDVMQAIGRFNGFCSVDLYDSAHSAIESGEKYAIEHNLTNKISFHHGDFTKVNHSNFDIGLLIGIICPLSDSFAKRVMHSIFKRMSKESVLIVSSSSDKMPEDVVGRFLIEYCADWYLQFRDSSRMEKLAKGVGLEPLEILDEPLKYHKLMVCRKA
jgi:chemotaxis methyl-accepting protein methylase